MQAFVYSGYFEQHYLSKFVGFLPNLVNLEGIRRAELGGMVDGRQFRLRVQQAMALLEPELEQPRALGEVARETGMSERQLRRVFARELGVGPRHFQRQLRLEHAHQLLVLGNVSVAEAAVAAGFRSRSAFSRAYRARFGHSPLADRH